MRIQRDSNFHLPISIDDDLSGSMPTISANVTKKELYAIREYANACGETMSNLIRKVMISEAVFLNCFGGPKEYECCFSVPDNGSGEEEDEIFKNSVNRIRRILGIEEIEQI